MRGQELEGTDSVGARKAGEPWKGMGLLQLQTAEAPKGPGAGDTEGPPGFGRPETETPQKTRDQKGAQVITHRDEWGRRSGGGAKEGPRDGRGTNPSPSLNP